MYAMMALLCSLECDWLEPEALPYWHAFESAKVRDLTVSRIIPDTETSLVFRCAAVAVILQGIVPRTLHQLTMEGRPAGSRATHLRQCFSCWRGNGCSIDASHSTSGRQCVQSTAQVCHLSVWHFHAVGRVCGQHCAA